MSDETIPRELLLDGEGHLTDEGATLIADGEEQLLPTDVRAHSEACDECLRRVGAAALLSASIGEMMRGERAVRTQEAAVATARAAFDDARASSRPPRALPVRAIAAGLALAAMGLVPSLAAGGAGWEGAGRTIAVLAKSLVAFARVGGLSGSPLGAALACASALTLTMLAVVVARRLPEVRWAERGA